MIFNKAYRVGQANLPWGEAYATRHFGARGHGRVSGSNAEVN
jgi:hypothetical protein